MYSVAISQLLSGDACQIGTAISSRSSRVIDRPRAAVVATSTTLRWLCTQPLGAPVVPDV